MKPKVLVTRRIHETALVELKKICDVILYDNPSPIPHLHLIELIADCEGIISMPGDVINAQVMAAAKNLKIIANHAVGLDNIDQESAQSKNIMVTNTPDVLTHATAELALGLLINSARRIPQSEQVYRQGKFMGWDPLGFLGRELGGQTLGIIGMGKIGQAMAKKAHALGMHIQYTGPTEKTLNFPAKYLCLEDLLAHSTFISFHCPLTSQTEKLMQEEQFNLLQKDVVLVNTARGKIICSKAFSEFLKKNPLASAAIDVTDPEPLSQTDPLWSIPNLFITPHIGSATYRARAAMGMMCVENVKTGLLKCGYTN